MEESGIHPWARSCPGCSRSTDRRDQQTKRLNGAPAPDQNDDKRGHSGYGRNTPTGQAKYANSTQQTEDNARRLTAELTGMHVKYKAAIIRLLRKASSARLLPDLTNDLSVPARVLSM